MLISTTDKINLKKDLIEKIIDSNLDLNKLSERTLRVLFNNDVNVSINTNILTLMKSTIKGDIYVNLDIKDLYKLKLKRRLKKLNKI
jgi:hypothetical protein